MNASILSIGDELTYGQSVDTNSAWMSQRLASVGCQIHAHQTVPDDQAGIELAIRALAERSDFVIVSGGLGPTADDLTRQAIAQVMQVDLVSSAAWMEVLKGFFDKRGRPMPPSNVVQALIPRGAALIENTSGTAAGIDATLKMANHECRLFAVPGVPSEMKIMFSRAILPIIQARGAGASIASQTLHTFGMGESAVGELLGSLMDRQRNPSVGTTLSQGVVSLRINSRAFSSEEAERLLQTTISDCRAALGNIVYGEGEETLAGAVARLQHDRRIVCTLATAETLSGGTLAALIGASPQLLQQLIVGKVAALGSPVWKLPHDWLVQHEASSAATAEWLATQARRDSGATIGLAIAGVWTDHDKADAPAEASAGVALAHEGGAISRSIHISRTLIRDYAAKTALSLLRTHFLSSYASLTHLPT